MLRTTKFQTIAESYPLDWFASPNLSKAIQFISSYDPDFFDGLTYEVKREDETKYNARSEKYEFLMPSSVRALTATTATEIQLKYKYEFRLLAKKIAGADHVFFLRREWDDLNQKKSNAFAQDMGVNNLMLKKLCPKENYTVLVFPDRPSSVSFINHNSHWCFLGKLGNHQFKPDVESQACFFHFLSTRPKPIDPSEISKFYFSLPMHNADLALPDMENPSLGIDQSTSKGVF